MNLQNSLYLDWISINVQELMKEAILNYQLVLDRFMYAWELLYFNKFGALLIIYLRIISKKLTQDIVMSCQLNIQA